MDPKKWIDKRIIFECISGSHAYGLNTETSDTDYRGVCIPPKDYYFGLYNFEQYIETKPNDRTIFDIKKFFHLASQCNPNIIELLFMPDDTIVKESGIWTTIKECRDLFLSKKCKHTYLGYAHSQLKRIKTHKHWLLNPPKNKPLRSDFGLPEHEKFPKESMGALESAIRDHINSKRFEILDYIANFLDIHTLGEDVNEGTFEIKQDTIDKMTPNETEALVKKLDSFSPEIMDIYKKERDYKNAKSNWDKYNIWLDTRNSSRSELEAKFGYDTKHASHICRLLLQGKEILTKQFLSVRLNVEDKEFCMAVKKGALTYDQLIEWHDAFSKEFDVFYKESKLPETCDINKISSILIWAMNFKHREDLLEEASNYYRSSAEIQHGENIVLRKG